jgi:hypothetical protein
MIDAGHVIRIARPSLDLAAGSRSWGRNQPLP